MLLRLPFVSKTKGLGFCPILLPFPYLSIWLELETVSVVKIIYMIKDGVFMSALIQLSLKVFKV